MAQPGTALALRAGFRKDFSVRIRAVAYLAMDENKNSRVIGLLDMPSRNSFGMLCLITKPDSVGYYEVTGLAPESQHKKIISPRQLDLLAGQYFAVELPLPENLSNPVALWLGGQFCARADGLNAPSLPKIDENWHQPLKPFEAEGWYSIKEPKETYQILEDFVSAVAIEALAKNSPDLASLMKCTLSFHPKTVAVDYFTQPDEQKKRRKLEYYVQCHYTKDGRRLNCDELKKELEKVRLDVLSNKK